MKRLARDVQYTYSHAGMTYKCICVGLLRSVFYGRIFLGPYGSNSPALISINENDPKRHISMTRESVLSIVQTSSKLGILLQIIQLINTDSTTMNFVHLFSRITNADLNINNDHVVQWGSDVSFWELIFKSFLYDRHLWNYSSINYFGPRCRKARKVSPDRGWPPNSSSIHFGRKFKLNKFCLTGGTTKVSEILFSMTGSSANALSCLAVTLACEFSNFCEQNKHISYPSIHQHHMVTQTVNHTTLKKIDYPLMLRAIVIFASHAIMRLL